jgi:hypothetical protein
MTLSFRHSREIRGVPGLRELAEGSHGSDVARQDSSKGHAVRGKATVD